MIFGLVPKYLRGHGLLAFFESRQLQADPELDALLRQVPQTDEEVPGFSLRLRRIRPKPDLLQLSSGRMTHSSGV